MVYIKRLVMHGFKSFVKKTELPFDQGINVILGPNGSGKSNVSDGLCFVLGRLSAKSMRAAKSSNLIFMGSKGVPPAKEAVVEAVFDNTDRGFSIDKDEVSIKRIVRRNGLSIYKINGETKTRQDVLALLAMSGIDPNGFNIILQGEIQNFVRMHNEERRKIIEEVSGISVYESRKEKSLKEMDKTEEKLKEVMAILRERTAYLNNLEKERQQALKFKKLEEDIKKFKASIISHDMSIKKKDIEKINVEIEKKNKDIEKIKKTILTIQTTISNSETKIKDINENIKKATGLEQEKLNKEISDVRAELAGLEVKVENYENKIIELEKQKADLKQAISEGEISLRELQQESPNIQKKAKEIEKKKKELEEIETLRKKFYVTKSELKSIKELLDDKNINLRNSQNESDFLLKQIDSIAKDIFDSKTSYEKLNILKISIAEKKSTLDNLNKQEREIEKSIFSLEHEILGLGKVVQDVSKIDICPLCKSKITPEHIKGISKETDTKTKELKSKIESLKSETKKISLEKESLSKEVENIMLEIGKRESDLLKLSNIDEKKEMIKNLHEKIDKIKEDIKSVEKRKKFLEESFDENSNIENKYESLRLELQDISIRNEENVNSEISYRQRELERAKITLKQISVEEEDLNGDLNTLKKELDSKETLLAKKSKQEEELNQKFNKLISERDSLQSSIRHNESEVLHQQNILHNVEREINEFKIHKAKFDAEYENFEIEMLSFPNIEIIKMSKEALTERLVKTQEIISNIGSVNLRSLEVYDSVKEEYDNIRTRVETIEKEKEGILKIIHEIDIKKKKVFNQTLDALNEFFSRNFSQLSTKGQVWLELEDKKDPFAGGVSIVVKVGQGKYFDVTSLSGGEQTIVALSLIFAIQEYKPYSFYILDEIDAALDKRNSERLASLLKRYMQQGQYIVITHNDEVITNATNLYGVSMHDGISKVTSLKV